MIPHSNTGNLHSRAANTRSIALVGLAGTGKDTLADHIAAAYGHHKLSFAAPLKRVVQSIYGFTDAQLFGPSRLRDEPDPRYPRAGEACLTPREALERIGTDACRKCYVRTWLDLSVHEAKAVKAAGGSFVFTDTRFENEIDALRDLGCLIVRLTRKGIVPGQRRWWKPWTWLRKPMHESEAHALLPESRFDFVLSTDGTIEETRAAFEEWFSKQ